LIFDQYSAMFQKRYKVLSLCNFDGKSCVIASDFE